MLKTKSNFSYKWNVCIRNPIIVFALSTNWNCTAAKMSKSILLSKADKNIKKKIVQKVSMLISFISWTYSRVPNKTGGNHILLRMFFPPTCYIRNSRVHLFLLRCLTILQHQLWKHLGSSRYAIEIPLTFPRKGPADLGAAPFWLHMSPPIT